MSRTEPVSIKEETTPDKANETEEQEQDFSDKGPVSFNKFNMTYVEGISHRQAHMMARRTGFLCFVAGVLLGYSYLPSMINTGYQAIAYLFPNGVSCGQCTLA